MLVKTYCAAVNGLEVTTVMIEVSLSQGVMYHLTGLGDEAVRESRDRIAAALQYNSFKFPVADITVNMAPGYRYFGCQQQYHCRPLGRIHDCGRIGT